MRRPIATRISLEKWAKNRQIKPSVLLYNHTELVLFADMNESVNAREFGAGTGPIPFGSGVVGTSVGAAPERDL
jgi:hypothetical protein